MPEKDGEAWFFSRIIGIKMHTRISPPQDCSQSKRLFLLIVTISPLMEHEKKLCSYTCMRVLPRNANMLSPILSSFCVVSGPI